jgi:ATP-dependent Clp protease adaptor protein ClpS
VTVAVNPISFRRMAQQRPPGVQQGYHQEGFSPMRDDIVTISRPKVEPKVARPKLYKVILLNDDYTPREFVVVVLKMEFGMSEEQAHRVMITAHKRGACVVAVFTKDVAETKATRGTEAGRRKGYPLMFTTEPEE